MFAGTRLCTAALKTALGKLLNVHSAVVAKLIPVHLPITSFVVLAQLQGACEVLLLYRAPFDESLAF